jgi:hypothetical protein
MSEPTIEQLKVKCFQAYQVLGYLDEMVAGNPDTPRPSDGEWVRVLDYLCDEDGFDEDFLPWPRAVVDDHAPVMEDDHA